MRVTVTAGFMCRACRLRVERDEVVETPECDGVEFSRATMPFRIRRDAAALAHAQFLCDSPAAGLDQISIIGLTIQEVRTP